MTEDEREKQMERLLKSVGDERENRIKPSEIGQVERNLLLEEVRRILVNSPGPSRARQHWTSALLPRIAWTAAAVTALLIIALTLSHRNIRPEGALRMTASQSGISH